MVSEHRSRERRFSQYVVALKTPARTYATVWFVRAVPRDGKVIRLSSRSRASSRRFCK